jgi:hypothetical protein
MDIMGIDGYKAIIKYDSVLYNGHGPTWSINTQAQPTTKHESNSSTYW